MATSLAARSNRLRQRAIDDYPPYSHYSAYWRDMGHELHRIRNDFKDHESSYKAYEDAQNQRQSMQTHLDKIMQLVGAEGGGQLQTHLKALQDGLASQSSALDTMIKSIPPRARRPSGAHELADKVFSIPELLERILLKLSTGDLLQVMQLNHHFFDTIQASPRIQMRMGLRGQEGCHIRFPAGPCELYALSPNIDNYCGWSYHGRKDLADDELLVRTDVYVSERNPLPKPGKRCRDILFCQPPIESMKIHTRCCSPSWPWRASHKEAEILRVEGGIRVGDLIDAFLRVTKQHKLCPDALPELHDEDGFVTPRISFETKVPALEDDPELLERHRIETRRKAEEDKFNSRQERMGPYIAAKRIARDNGEPIPTLAEFEKTRDEAANDTMSSVLPST